MHGGANHNLIFMCQGSVLSILFLVGHASDWIRRATPTSGHQVRLHGRGTALSSKRVLMLLVLEEHTVHCGQNRGGICIPFSGELRHSPSLSKCVDSLLPFTPLVSAVI